MGACEHTLKIHIFSLHLLAIPKMTSKGIRSHGQNVENVAFIKTIVTPAGS